MTLDVRDVHAYYGKSHILQGVSLQVKEGETVTLLGRNGAGKSTTLKTIAGVVAPRGGAIGFAGKTVSGQPAHRIASAGLCFVPEHRGIFRLLSVEENLRLGARKDSPWQLADIYRIFPRLEERRKNGGAQLSGGEQQMLAIGRALMNHPRLLMLDEPVEGLEVCTQLADRHYIIEQGVIVYEGGNAEFAADHTVKDRYLGVGVV
jgi:branched-chain amino acid transport system ATP-binding protein